MRSAAQSLILVILAATPLAAQDQPDFSGRWVLVSDSRQGSDIPRALSVRQELVRTNVRGEPMQPFFKTIAIDRDYEDGTPSEIHEIGIIYGVVPGIARGGGPSGPRGHRAVKWDQDDLVFESGSYTGETPATGMWSERREVWSRQPDGRLSAAITTSGSDAPTATIVLVYRRP